VITVHVLVAWALLATGELKVETSHHWSNEDCIAAALAYNARLKSEGVEIKNGSWMCAAWRVGPMPPPPPPPPLAPKRNS
jgi:hypothetical protein